MCALWELVYLWRGSFEVPPTKINLSKYLQPLPTITPEPQIMQRDQTVPIAVAVGVKDETSPQLTNHMGEL